jgi:hypothetical protein
MQQKTQRPVQFEVTEQTRTALETWIHPAQLRSEDCLFPSRLHASDPLFTRQYARIVKAWVDAIGLDPAMYGTQHNEAHESSTDLLQDEEPKNGSAAARPYKV